LQGRRCPLLQIPTFAIQADYGKDRLLLSRSKADADLESINVKYQPQTANVSTEQTSRVPIRTRASARLFVPHLRARQRGGANDRGTTRSLGLGNALEKAVLATSERKRRVEKSASWPIGPRAAKRGCRQEFWPQRLQIVIPDVKLIDKRCERSVEGALISSSPDS